MLFDYRRGRPNLVRVMLLLEAPTETKTAEAAPAEAPKDTAAKPVVKRVRKVAAKTPGDAKPEGGAKDGE